MQTNNPNTMPAVEKSTDKTSDSVSAELQDKDTPPALVALDAVADQVAASLPCFDINELPTLEAIASRYYDGDVLIGAPTPSPFGPQPGPRYHHRKNQVPLEPHLVAFLEKKSDCLNNLARENSFKPTTLTDLAPAPSSWITAASMGSACLAIMCGVFAYRRLFFRAQPQPQTPQIQQQVVPQTIVPAAP